MINIRNYTRKILLHFAYLIGMLFMFTACERSEVEPQHGTSITESDPGDVMKPSTATYVTTNIKVIKHGIVNDIGQTPINASDIIFTAPGQNGPMNPVTDLYGTQMTLGQFSNVTGKLTAKCSASGTSIKLNLNGLIPNAYYSVFISVFHFPGYADDASINLIGQGVLGDYIDTSTKNDFRASATGTATVLVNQKQGPLSIFGDTPECLVSDNNEEYLVTGVYHIDGLTHGLTMGPAGTYAEQFGFSIKAF